MPTTTRTMPIAMRVLLVAISVQLATDIAAFALAIGEVPTTDLSLEVGAFAVDLAVVVLLARGSELARSLVRMAAGVGMVFDAWLLAVTITWAPSGPVGAVVIAAAALLFGFSALTFLILGREDVRAWVFDRWLDKSLAP